MVPMCRLLLLFNLLKNVVPLTFEIGSSESLDVVIFGGAGDLAKRYLWNGIFKLYQDKLHQAASTKSMRFYGTGRRPASVMNTDGHDPVKSILQERIYCPDDDVSCGKQKQSFINQSNYVEVKTYKHYEFLCASLNNSTYADHEIIFYLSVPPSSYKDIIETLSAHCVAQNPRWRHKFVFEKPFGTDYDSAVALAKMLKKHLNESQIFRMDHYLGKSTVTQILQFRQKNPGIEKLLNRNYVKHVEVIAKESVGAEDRIPYYDNSGVIRDMLQSHLTEILCLLTMNISKNAGKLSLLNTIGPIKSSDVLLGQYNGYQQEVFDQSGVKNSPTQTFAVAKLSLISSRWRSVPCILLSGKKMDTRVGYARILFRNRVFRNTAATADCESAVPQIVFFIGHGKLNMPAILVSRILPVVQDVNLAGWVETQQFDSLQIFGNHGKCFRIFVPELLQKDAYTYLISQVHGNGHQHFVPMDTLLQSWRIWTPLLKNVSQSGEVIKYSIGSSENGALKFKISLSGLSFAGSSVASNACLLRNIVLKKCDLIPDERTFLGYPAIRGTEDVITRALAEDFEEAVLSVGKNDFHMAFSGGSSPVSFYNYAAANMSGDVPWHQIHFWQVDERCSAEHSNFMMLKTLLFDKVSEIDQNKIHPMPTPARGFECSQKSADMYEGDLLGTVGPDWKDPSNTTALDFIVLGMGHDGHTASLFPGSPLINEHSRLVAVDNFVGQGVVSPERMTLTFRAINNARYIAVVIKGKKKCRTMQYLLKHCGGTRAGSSLINTYPICGVDPKHGHLKWYISESCPTK